LLAISGNNLDILKGDLKEYCSIGINGQWEKTSLTEIIFAYIRILVF